MRSEILSNPRMLGETSTHILVEVSVNTEDGLRTTAARFSKASTKIADGSVEVPSRSVAALEQRLRREHPEWGRLNVRVQGDPRQLWLAFP